MGIELASWSEIVETTRQSHDIWSGGLPLYRRIEFMSQQMHQMWARRHIKRFVLREKSKAVSSLKLLDLDFSAKSRRLRLFGLGGIFTPEKLRGHGFARKLIEGMVKIAKEKQIDGILLYSDIGTDFYQRIGFQTLGGRNIVIDIGNGEGDTATLIKSTTNHEYAFSVQPLEESQIPQISCHYSRWLRRQNYGHIRSDGFWTFRIWFEKQFQTYSKWDWPVQELVTVRADEPTPGYAIVECGSNRMRVLEVIGPDFLEPVIWEHLIRLAKARSLEKVHGWEATAPQIPNLRRTWVERNWGTPMIRPLSEQIGPLLDGATCQLLELDHF